MKNEMNKVNLWDDLTSIHLYYLTPWCFLGDFNTISGSHEHRGRVAYNRSIFLDFIGWIYQNNLVDLETIRAFFLL